MTEKEKNELHSNNNLNILTDGIAWSALQKQVNGDGKAQAAAMERVQKKVQSCIVTRLGLQKRVDKKLRDIFDKDLKTQVDAAARAAAAKVVNLPLIALERACGGAGADRPHLSKCSAWCQRCVPSTPDSWARAERDFLEILTGKLSLA